MQVPPDCEINRAGNRIWIRPRRLAGTLDPLMPLPLADLRLTPGSQPAIAGREGPFHIPAPSGDERLLIRPFGRGGLLAGMLPKGFRNLDRGLKELGVGAKARAFDLPVAELVALSAEQLPSKRWSMEGWSWWLTGTSPLPTLLKDDPGNPESRGQLLRAVAETIRRCHTAGLSHRDLNANNIIVKRQTQGFQATLVDLDGAEFMNFLPRRLKLAQLRRLYRSLAKEGIIPSVLSNEEYSGFIREYFLGDIAPRELAAFMRRSRVTTYWHSLLWRR